MKTDVQIKMLRTGIAAILLAASFGLFTGCAAVPAKYHPETVGYTNPPESSDHVRITITPLFDSLALGEPVVITVSMENVGEKPIFVPRSPEILLLWIYPNGQRDNQLIQFTEERHFRADELVRLMPGQFIETRREIKTYYFPKVGITEFWAVCNAPRNTNPALGPVWSGRLESNGYGLLVHRPNERRYQPRDTMLAGQ